MTLALQGPVMLGTTESTDGLAYGGHGPPSGALRASHVTAARTRVALTTCTPSPREVGREDPPPAAPGLVRARRGPRIRALYSSGVPDAAHGPSALRTLPPSASGSLTDM